jgi:hypothetical protein
MTVTAGEWIEQFANQLGLVAPSQEQQDQLLELAGVVAHASERTAAPISCWLAARAGVEPGDAGSIGTQLAEEIGARS